MESVISLNLTFWNKASATRLNQPEHQKSLSSENRNNWGNQNQETVILIGLVGVRLFVVGF